MSARPFRFGFMAGGSLFKTPPSRAKWIETVRRIEGLGLDTLLVPDHLTSRLGPIAALASAAMVTTTLRLGSLVFGNDFRNPVLLAQEVATIDVLSDGRFELGLGTGYMPSDYRQTGVPFDPPGVRVDRLIEAVRVLKGAFAGEPFSFSGTHFTATDVKLVPPPIQTPHPPLVVGGAGKRILSFAAREADVVAFNPRMQKG